MRAHNELLHELQMLDCDFTLTEAEWVEAAARSIERAHERAFPTGRSDVAS